MAARSRPWRSADGPGSRSGSRPWLGPGPWSVAGSASVPGLWSTRRPGSGPGWSGWRLTSTRVTVASQARRRQASRSSIPTQPVSPPSAPGRPSRLSRSTVTSSCGRTPPALGSCPPSRDRRHNSVRASAVRWSPLRSSPASAGPATPSRKKRRSRSWFSLFRPRWRSCCGGACRAPEEQRVRRMAKRRVD